MIVFEWIQENPEDFIKIIFLCMSVVFNLVLFFKTRNVKYLKEISDLIKYKTAQTAQEVEPGKYVQNFDGSNLKPVYRLNKSTGELEITDEVIDIQQLIDSCKDIALQACLDRLMPQAETESEDLAIYDSMRDDLDEMTAAIELANDYRVQFGLGDCSVEEVFRVVGQHADELKKKLNEKEIVKNEKSQEAQQEKE